MLKAKMQKLSKKRSNIFLTYCIMFASIFLVTFLALGISLMIVVNTYSLHEKTDLLQENTATIAESVSHNLIVNNMNSSYSPEKVKLCESLAVISQCTGADIFICDTGGNVIMCKDRIGVASYFSAAMVCSEHALFSIDDSMIQRVYESGTAVDTAVINGDDYYVVGTAIQAPSYFGSLGNDNGIIGSVFAVVESGTTHLVMSIIRIFVVIALICFSVGFLMILILTKKMVTPLQQMSAAAKQFAVGDFSYRVTVDSDDELADLGNAFNDMADALDKIESSRRSFVANVSHELKTPMTSISGFIDGILDGTIPKEREDYYLKIVSDEVKRLSRLVVAMLNMSKMESGDFVMNPKQYNLSDQIFHILLTFEQKIEKKNIEILGLDDGEDLFAYADADMIYQVVYNLLDNAVKFTNENGYIRLKVRELEESIEVSIKNSGEGIDSSELSRIFERFYKIDKSRSLDSKGVGLGLYIVKMMVEMNGGRIFARSDSNSEAEFVFTLPKSK